MGRNPDIKAVKVMLQDRVEDICREFLPRGRRMGRQWVSANPVTGDEKKDPAFKVYLAGADAGGWKDWRSGDGGDIIGLMAYLHGHGTRDHAAGYRIALDWLGYASMSDQDREKARQKAEQAKKKAAAQDEKERKRQLDRGLKLFRSGQESWHEWSQQPGSRLMPVQQHFVNYLYGRNIAIDQIANLDTMTFRFSPSTEYWTKGQWTHENGYARKVQDGPSYPCAHAAIRNPFGQIIGCHCTFLDPLEPRKAPEKPAKLMRGFHLGGFISLSLGPSGKNPFINQEPGLIAVAEGIETGLTVAEAEPEARVWAAGSLAGFGQLPIDMACVGEVIVCRDNNDGNKQAEDQFAEALDSLEKHGKPVTVINSPVGDDFNDLANEERQQA
jgi:hypothetical protein